MSLGAGGATAVLCALAGLAAGCGGGQGAGTASAPVPRAAVTPRSAGGSGAAVAVVPAADRDTEADQAFVQPAGSTAGVKAEAPSSVKAHRPTTAADGRQGSVSPGAPSDAEVRRELQELQGIQASQKKLAHAATSEVEAGITRAGNARTAAGLPDAVARVIAGGNAIARYPYVYGGGHASFVDSAYDCSGSVSYALAAGGFLNRPLTSGQLARSGAPGPGRWITIYANAGHTFMYVGGLRFDTSGRGGPRGSRWQTAPRSLAGFTVRHPPGY